MSSKTEEYLALAQRTANGLTRYWESWTDYLTTASRLYKYPFADQLMIYAQRPDATACADFDIWNNRMNRYVRRDAKGITLLDESSGFPRLHYVFDVSDTGVRRNSRDPEMWQYNDDLKQPVSEMLRKTYGISGERVSQQLADVAGKLVADYWDNNGGDICAIVDGSLLMDYDDAGVEMQFKSAAAISVTYTLLERCGFEPAGWFDKDDFQAIYNFSTPDSVYALGAAVSDMSREVLRNIERTVKTTIRRRNAERSQYEYEQQERDLLDRRGLPAPEPDPEPAPEAAGQVRQAAPDVPDEPSPGAVQHDAPEREPVPAPDGGGADGREPDAADHGAASETEPGSGQGTEPDGVGAAHEQPESAGRGTGADGADLQLSFLDVAIPTEAQQIEKIDRAESEKTPSAFVLSQAEIENELRKHGSGFAGGKQRIMALYQTQTDRNLRAKALAKEYGIGGHSHDFLDGSRGFVNHDGKGLEFDHYPEHKKFTLSWTQMEKYIDLMIQSDRYLTDKEKEYYTPPVPVSAKPDDELTHAKKLIREFCQEEYDSEPDFSDLSKIDIAYTNATDEEIPIQVNVDLVGYRVERYLGDILVDERQYESLEDLTETELEALDFSELVSVTDEELELYHSKAEERPALLPLDAATEYNALKEQHPDALVGFEQNGQFEFYGEDARKVCELVGGKLLEKETELGTVPVTGFPSDQWAHRAKQLWQCGENVYLAGLNEDGTHHQTKYLRREDYLPLGATVHMEGRVFRVDTVNFDKGSVTLQDVALAEMRMPIFREEPLAVVRELYEQEQGVMERPLPDYKVGDNVIVDLSTRTIEGTIGYVGETDVRIDTSAQGQSWDNEVINKRQFEDGLRQVEPELSDEELDALPISAVMDGKVQTFPDAAALDEALNAKAAPEPAGNFHITDDHLGEGGAKQKYARNIEAIRTLFKLEQEHRGATAEEQQVLSQYVGWGGLADAFDPGKDSWAKEYAELKGLLSEDEYAAARSSTLNAHYTSPVVIRSIYDAVEKMGFQSGNILEPSMGAGNFFGMLPTSMADSRLYGVELDSITGRIAKKLYPQADITVAGFETTDRRDFYDLAVGNVPFGQYKVNDKAYNKLGFSIHNYFFAKAIDQVRPGGIVAFVTSRYTMDSKDSTARKHMAERADFLGAIRLPNNAFRANAGTDVVSDIIFLQKRDRPIDHEPEGTGYRARTRFAKFFNLPELMSMFKEVADIKTSDQLHLPVPDAKFETVVAKPSEIQKEMVQELSRRAAKIHSGTVDASEDNMLCVTNDGRKIGLDVRLMNPILPDDPNSKLNTCVRNVLQIWADGKEQKLTQLLFCDLSTPKNDGNFNVYDDIRKKLVAAGVPESEVEFIHNADTEAKKAALFSKVRSGDVRILLGSTAKMGAGTNVQQRLAAVHHLDVGWKPSDMTQRNGRIIRQGNMNKEVKVFNYVTEGTFDSYLFQTLENKQRFISQIMTSKSPVRSCDDVDEQALSYAEIKALCAGNPLIKEKMDLDVQVAKLKVLKADHQSQKFRLEDKLLTKFPADIQETNAYIAGVKADAELAAAHPQEKEGFCGITIKGVTYDEKKTAGERLLLACSELPNSEEKVIGSYRGFELSLRFDTYHSEYQALLKGQRKYSVALGKDPLGCIIRLDNSLNNFPERIASAENELATLKQQQEAAQIEVEKPFPQEEELAEKSARLAELNAQLDMDEKGHEPEQDEEEQEDEPRRPSVLAALEEKADKAETVKPFKSFLDKDGDAR